MKKIIILCCFAFALISTCFAQEKDSIPYPGPFDEGYFFAGTDDLLKFKGYAQMDANFPIGNSPGISEFMIRRARLAATGYFQKNFRYMIYARFDKGKAELNEAFLESRHLSFARIRIGQFKVPFSLYNLTSSSQIRFVNRPLVVENLSPGYDIGAMVFGNVLDERIEYAIGIFNGEGQNNKEINDQKDLIGRLVVCPFRANENEYINNLYIGFSSSYSPQKQPFQTSVYETGTGQIFYSRSDSLLQWNGRTRLGFDMEWIVKKASLRAEYLQQKYNIEGGKSIIDDGLTLDLAYLLTDDNQQRNSIIKPNNELLPNNGSWGAFELTLRYEYMNLSDNTSNLQNTKGPGSLKGITTGVNWYPNDDVKIALNYQKLDFSSHLPTGQKEYKYSEFIKFRAQYQF